MCDGLAIEQAAYGFFHFLYIQFQKFDLRDFWEVDSQIRADEQAESDTDSQHNDDDNGDDGDDEVGTLRQQLSDVLDLQLTACIGLTRKVVHGMMYGVTGELKLKKWLIGVNQVEEQVRVVCKKICRRDYKIIKNDCQLDADHGPVEMECQCCLRQAIQTALGEISLYKRVLLANLGEEVPVRASVLRKSVQLMRALSNDWQRNLRKKKLVYGSSSDTDSDSD